MKTNIHPVVLMVGTRPEAIKMIPVYFACKAKEIPVVLCSTDQHQKLLYDVFDIFDVVPDYQLNIMRSGQDIFYITHAILQKTKELFSQIEPRIVMVQGDTTSAMAAALSSFYAKIPVMHVEAGLRTHDIYAPFPEEGNRRIITAIASHHFAPTSLAVDHLRNAGVAQEDISLTGNTVVDALKLITQKIETGELQISPFLIKLVHDITEKKGLLGLLTTHRREVLENKIDDIFSAINELLVLCTELTIIYPYHHNPLIIQAIDRSMLQYHPRLILLEAMPNHELIYVINNAQIIITDSGGIQEEAVSLGKQVIILREKTERQEAVSAGYAFLVGSCPQQIITTSLRLLRQNTTERPTRTNIFGDGTAAQKIACYIASYESSEEIEQKHHMLDTKIIPSIVAQKGSKYMEKVAVIGLGYIGLPTAVIIAESGYSVLGYDIDENRVNRINQGDPVIYEPEIYERLACVLPTQLLHASTQLTSADYYIIAVPTPITSEKKADISAVVGAAEKVAQVLSFGQVIIIESTVSVGTTRMIANMLQERTGFIEGKDFYVVHCPERVLPNNIFNELITNDRIIGVSSAKASELTCALYQSFVRGSLHVTSWEEAELIKLIENSSRDVQIAFAHQVASIARKLQLNPYKVIDLVNKHPRVSVLKPTCGVGGHCIAVDPWFLIESFPESTNLLHAARTVNDSVPHEVLHQINGVVETWKTRHDRLPRVILLGLAYKPNIDDMRESPALHIARMCAQYTDRHTYVFDPHCNYDIQFIPQAYKLSSLTESIEIADIVVFLVAHNRFSLVDQKILQQKQTLDFCGILYNIEQQLNHVELRPSVPCNTISEYVSTVEECDL